ncbi:hypothetical protein L2E82_11531 [Cichorium intybus]|uniref:Uncharacterized protein n=1 Tax=Cichorium intybus TaxID=13427 RepID=A0ACB9GDB9_CICIN|nr:hypothetical protein L2E82_11531 [Cichorium intybus]
MGRRKRLCITSTNLNEPVEDHVASETQGGQSNFQECQSINRDSSDQEICTHEQAWGKWRTWKGSLKTRGYDPSLTIDEIVTQQTENDNRVNPTQFKELVTRWFTPEFQSTCAKKRSSRSMMHEPHVTGTKSFARLAHEVLYVTAHTRKDGSIVNDKSAEVVASLKAIATDSTSTPGCVDDFTNDDYSKVKGPEKRGSLVTASTIPQK